MILPEDNDSAIDLDPILTTVLIEEFEVSDFEIQIEDEGIGLDDRSVTSANVTLILNGTVLQAGTDYIFHFDPIGDVIRLNMRADVAPRRNVYEIVLANDSADRHSRRGGQWAAAESDVRRDPIHDHDGRSE